MKMQERFFSKENIWTQNPSGSETEQIQFNQLVLLEFPRFFNTNLLFWPLGSRTMTPSQNRTGPERPGFIEFGF